MADGKRPQLHKKTFPIGTQANLKIKEEVFEKAKDVQEGKLSAVKMVIEKESLALGGTFPVGDTLAGEFASIAASFEDKLPCAVLLRLKSTDSDDSTTETDFALVSWTPGDSPVKLKMLASSSKKTVKDAFPDFNFKEYAIHDREDATFAAYSEATRPKTDDDRHATMSSQEIVAEEAIKEQENERRSAPKMLPGMGSMAVTTRSSFEETVEALLKEDSDAKCVLANLVGKGDELEGTVLEGISCTEAPADKLPKDPTFLLFFVPATFEETTKNVLVMAMWTPEGSSIQARMRCSAMKGAVLQCCKDVALKSAQVEAVTTTEASNAEELTDKLERAARLFVKREAAPAEGAGSAEGASEEGKPKGFVPPPGAMRMPGMGVKMPGM